MHILDDLFEGGFAHSKVLLQHIPFNGNNLTDEFGIVRLLTNAIETRGAQHLPLKTLY